MFTFDDDTKKTFKLAPAGTHFACLYQFFDLGSHDEEFEGKKTTRRKCRLTFELYGKNCTLEDGQPMSIGQTYTSSMGEKAKLRAHLESWRGNAYTNEYLHTKFDIRKFLGRFCMVNIVHKMSRQGKEYAQIASISGIPDGVNPPVSTPINKIVFFTLNPDVEKFRPEVFDALPSWAQTKIKGTKEYEAATTQNWVEDYKTAATDDFTSDIPF